MIELRQVKENEIEELSKLATKIVREHYDPIIGVDQNTYMLNLFQSSNGIKLQINNGYAIYWAIFEGKKVGYFEYKPIDGKMYLNKLYVDKAYRGNKISVSILDFIIKDTKNHNMSKIFLNVNKHNDLAISIYKHFGFEKIREECNDIGNGYYMDDYVLEYTI